jgi:hypothetical protein
MEPFQEQFVVHLNAGIANGGQFMTVPARKRAVIEHVSVSADPPGANTANYFITSTIGNPPTANFREVPIFTARTQGTNVVIGSHPIRAYANPGTEFGAVIRRIETSHEVIATFVLAGHYEPV